MKVAVVGCGAVGGYYGAKLCKTGLEIYFLVRSDWEAVAQNGMRIISDEGNVIAHPNLALVPDEVGPVDLVIVAVKSTANDDFEQLIGPLVGDHTAILTLQNGLGNEARLADLFGAEKILGGLCFVCLNRVEPGVIHHIAYGRITLGELANPPLDRTHEIAELFQNAGIDAKVTNHLEEARWRKLVWNIPFNGLGVASAAGYDALISGEVPEGFNTWDTFATDQLLNDPKWEAIVRELMEEVAAIAHELGMYIEPEYIDEQIELTRQMGNYRPSTLVDYEAGKAIELEAMFMEPLMVGRTVGLESPRLEILCRILQQMDPASADAGSIA